METSVARAPGSLSVFLRNRAGAILSDWTTALERRPPAEPRSYDHLPALLERIAAAVDDLATGRDAELTFSDQPARDRLEPASDLCGSTSELALLRECVVRRWEAETGSGTGLLALHQAIDAAIVTAIDRYTHTRDRTRQALDRISHAALDSRDLEDLLQRLLQVFLETTPAVDTAAILLRDGEELRVRATIGLDAEIARQAVLRVGDGFAGTIAATRKPLFSSCAFTDPIVRSEAIRKVGVRALYGVPLIDTDQVLGVAHMGSLTAFDFSQEDRRLFAAMASRATLAIWQHVMRESAERAIERERRVHAEAARAHAVLDSLLESSLVGIAFLDNDLRYVHINRALAAANGLPPEQHLGRTVQEVLGPAARFVEPLLRHVMQTGKPQTDLEATVPMPDGRGRTFLASYFPVRTASGDAIGIGGTAVEITDRKRMEEDLRERELRLRALADNIAQLAWMADESGRAFWFNERWFDYTGTTIDQVEGWGWEQLQHPDHAARVGAKLRTHFESGEVWEDTFPLRGRDGRYRWFLSRALPIRDDSGRVVRWFGTNTDVTEHRFLAEETATLTKSLDFDETLHQLALLAVPALADWCAVDLCEPGGAVRRVALVHADPAKQAVADEYRKRFPPDMDIASGVTRVIRTGVPELVGQVADECLRAEGNSAEQRAMLSLLGLRSFVTVPLAIRGRAIGALSFVVTDEARPYTPASVEFLSEVARRAAIAIDNARLFQEAENAARMRRELLAIVSHDLKNPLSVIHMASTALLRKADDQRARRQLEAIGRSVSRMEHLIGDLLDMANIDAGRLAIAADVHDAAAIVREAAEFHQPLAHEKGVELTWREPEGTVHARCDRDRILQVFGNVIGNAIKFCSPSDSIAIAASVVGPQLRFEVADSGPGMPAEHLRHMFQPYWSGTRQDSKSAGLGLFISKGIVEAHGGRMWAESVPGRGSTFYFTVPLE